MNKKALQFFVFVLGAMLSTHAQKQSFKDDFSFKLKRRVFRSEEWAEKMRKGEESDKKETTKDLKFDLPKPPPIESYDVNGTIHFDLRDGIIQIYTTAEREGDTVEYDEKFLDQNSLEYLDFNADSGKYEGLGYSRTNSPITDNFELLAVNKDKIKIICGYTCYEQLYKSKTNSILYLQLYGTDEIDFNYNPAFDDIHLMKTFYPLYVKRYFESEFHDFHEIIFTQ
jgi:hypothetical protein